MSAHYIFRLDDIAPNMHWDNFVRIKKLFRAYGVRPIVGVIPANDDPELLKFPCRADDFWEEMRTRSEDGWHIAMHGYRHHYDSENPGLLGITPQSEFAGHRYEEQRSRLLASKKIFDDHGIRVTTFMAPSHSFDENTLLALKEIGITTITDGFGLFPFFYKELLFVPQLTEWPRPFPLGVHTFCLHLNETRADLFQAIESFLENYHEFFINFEDAERYVSRSVVNEFFGMCARKVLELKRRGVALP